MIASTETKLPADLKISEYFTFYGSWGIDWGALNDPANNPILNACLRVATEEDLKSLGIANLRERLTRLERGGLIKKSKECYSLAFPAIVGQKRAQLQEYIEQTAKELLPLGRTMIEQIRQHLKDREEMLYHVLWSDIMDGPLAWDMAQSKLKEQIKTGDISITNKAWLLYPAHPFRVGTNSYNIPSGHLRITWSRNTPSPNAIRKIISKHEDDFVEAIEKNSSVKTREAREAFHKHGLVDEAGKVQIYALDSETDFQAVQDYMKLGEDFGREIVIHLDTAKIANMLEVPAGVALLIAYHEVSWQLLQNLAEEKVLKIPRIVTKAGTDPKEAYQLVSLIGSINLKNLLLTKKLYSLRSDADPRTTEVYEEFIEKKYTGNADCWCTLAIRLIECNYWDEAFDCFERFKMTHKEQEGNYYFTVMVWQGHIYDLRGQRDKAIAKYESALRVKHRGGTRHDQWGIVLNRDWVEERLKRPFTKKMIGK